MQSDLTLYEFNSFTKNEKVKALCNHGAYLSERTVETLRIVLYQLSSFYVEVKYDTESNKIVEFQVFINTIMLEPYLEQIDISNLLAA